MTKRQAENYRMLVDGLRELGFDYDEIDRLHRIEMTLHRWSEAECGDSNDYCSWAIERDENTNKPYRVTYPHDGPSRRHAIADRETGALNRLKAICANHPGIWFYYQTDCRGCALYVGTVEQLRGDKPDNAYSRGIAVCY